MGYGDSGLPDDHAFSHNVMPLYALECARQAALELGQSGDAGWLANEYNDYKAAILTAIRRAVKLEKDGPPYLPAAPTYPEGAVSQTLLAVFPSRLISPDDPLVTGLLARMERTALQGLPSNMGWLGPSGVWPGESMDVAETYLLRGEVEKTADLLVATMDHSYSTKVWREEMLVDNTLPTACGKPRSDAKNQTGSGDMPEAWAHANLVILLRNMLLREEEGGLHLLSGIPASWIGVGEKISVQDAPTMLGGKLSYTLSYLEAGKMNLDLSPPPGARWRCISR
jgi:GH15 family glucan-1,4-alpha-glucosidase